ncbi:MAG: fumarylacetoacetate hydrolase family protein [Solirubrobacteraceae bacterium]|jgi:2-keto-4-pentenoate hydratase/2-oxohepta-3-ene-1,7-dioic acid hydratase in catechol pathway
MRLANLNGRLMAADAGCGFVDVALASEGRFDPDPQLVYERWEEFLAWSSSGALLGDGDQLGVEALGPPVPRPRQLFAVALNYAEHAAESGSDAPTVPQIFTKFPSCLAGPRTGVTLPGAFTDWEAELVVVIGHRAHHVTSGQAWEYVAGLMVGQDLSARDVQRSGPTPQFSLGKSFPGFGPTGPWLVSVDEYGEGDAEIECVLNGERVQHASTGDMTFSIAQLIAHISSITPMLPGDLMFTGTPPGVGAHRRPPVFLRDGDELVSRISRIGEISQTFHDR